MMRCRTIAALAALTAALAAAPAAHGDCCPCPIVRGENPYAGKPPEVKPKPDEIPEDKDKDKGKDAEKPKTDELAGGDEVGGLGGNFVEEEQQQGVIAWNGKEEILVLTTNEKLLLKKGTAVLHFMPLPGKVKDIYRANRDIFKKAKTLVRKKLGVGVGGTLDVVFKKKIGAHNIFVWKLEDPKEFPRRVQKYVMDNFGKGAKAMITKKMFGVVTDYYNRGFRYFAFDLVLMKPEKATKMAIAYHFESPKSAYYPLVISSAGATGDTFIDLVIFTKREVKSTKTKLGGGSEVTRLGNRSAPITHAELAGLDARMARLFDRGAALRGQIFQITDGKLQDFKSDFEAR
jgi:hypothetical protein